MLAGPRNNFLVRTAVFHNFTYLLKGDRKESGPPDSKTQNVSLFVASPGISALRNFIVLQDAQRDESVNRAALLFKERQAPTPSAGHTQRRKTRCFLLSLDQVHLGCSTHTFFAH